MKNPRGGAFILNTLHSFYQNIHFMSYLPCSFIKIHRRNYCTIWQGKFICRTAYSFHFLGLGKERKNYSVKYSVLSGEFPLFLKSECKVYTIHAYTLRDTKKCYNNTNALLQKNSRFMHLDVTAFRSFFLCKPLTVTAAPSHPCHTTMLPAR